MKTIHAARPHYPAYRDISRMTARRPVLELALAGLLLGFILAGALALIEVIQTVAAQ